MKLKRTLGRIIRWWFGRRQGSWQPGGIITAEDFNKLAQQVITVEGHFTGTCEPLCDDCREVIG